jgi:phosphoribosylformylglycinamidine cyclo-ligase
MKRAERYSEAGVDLESAARAKSRLAEIVESTFTEKVVGDFGDFGSVYSLTGIGRNDSYLVSSADGVGTKLKVAIMVSRHDTIGHDLVNHLVNDILCLGARPLFFMDYIGIGKMDEDVVSSLVSGFAAGCRENGCALIGGETAEMPGLYAEDEYDLAGFIVGVTRRNLLPDKQSIKPGDVIVGFSSTGLHTNGFSLARKAFFETAGMAISDVLPETGRKIGDDLLSVHKSYFATIYPLVRKKLIKGLAHITGGGFEGNISRILPSNVDALIDTTYWKPPGVFRAIERIAAVEKEEMYRVFNMGIGLVIVAGQEDRPNLRKMLRGSDCEVVPVGVITEGTGQVHLKF